MRRTESPQPSQNSDFQVSGMGSSGMLATSQRENEATTLANSKDAVRVRACNVRNTRRTVLRLGRLLVDAEHVSAGVAEAGRELAGVAANGLHDLSACGR